MKPIIVAHRGLHDEHPENSQEALRAAWHAGIEWCECDVRGSLEHDPFLMHDETLDRTTLGHGPIASASTELLEALRVPSLKYLAAGLPAVGKLLVEIKPQVHREVVNRTLDCFDPEQCVIQSFDLQILRHAAKRRKDLRLHLLVEELHDFSAGPWEQVNAPFETLNESTVKGIREMGFRIGAWTVNDPLDIRRMLALNIDMIISDAPLLARDICQRIG